MDGHTLIGSVVGWEPGGDTLFDPTSDRNRDDCLEPWRVLRAALKAHGVSLHTADFNLCIEAIDVVAAPRNSDLVCLERFDAVLTWESRSVDGRRCYIGLNYPNPLLPTRFGFAKRPGLCTMISANKVATGRDGREFCTKRAEALHWFARHAPDRFNLYGIGWDKPPKRPGQVGKFNCRSQKLWHRLTRTPPVPSYRGRVAAKRDVLERSRFCICFENAQGIDDYITEKLFGALFTGCVPVFWGAPNIRDRVPPAFARAIVNEVLADLAAQRPAQAAGSVVA